MKDLKEFEKNLKENLVPACDHCPEGVPGPEGNSNGFVIHRYRGRTIYYDNQIIEGYFFRSKGKNYILTQEGADCIETHYFGQENEIHIAEVEEVERIW